jgi:hypothetical protein
MNNLNQAYIARAQSALSMLNTDSSLASAFTEIAFEMTKSARPDDAVRALERSQNPKVQAYAKAAALTADGWAPEGRELAAAYLATIAELSLVESLAKFARVIPENVGRVLIASDAVGGSVDEGHPKPVIEPGLDPEAFTALKAAAIIVANQEYFLSTGDAGRKLIERELSSAVGRASNAAVLDHYAGSSTIEVTGTGDPLADLRAGLMAAGPSLGYVVAASTGAAAVLATHEANRGGMGIRGGTFAPGIEIVAVDSFSGLLVIPASRVAIQDRGLEIRGAGHASVDMRDTPESPAQLVSLWQTNCYGLVCERLFTLGGDAVAVHVTESAS